MYVYASLKIWLTVEMNQIFARGFQMKEGGKIIIGSS